MPTETTVFLILGALSGGFINGLAGTGTAMFALGFYLVVLPPLNAVAIVALMSVLVGLQGLWIVRASIRANPARLLRFVLPGLLGVPVGLVLLSSIDAGTLRLGIAVLLIIYGAFFTIRRSLPAYTRPTPVVDLGVGFVGGVMGGAASVSGAVPQMWVSIRPWTKAETRAVLQPFNATILTTSITLLFFKGAFDETALRALAVTLPVGFVAAQIGISVFRRLSDETFRRLLIALTFLMGIGIFISEVA